MKERYTNIGDYKKIVANSSLKRRNGFEIMNIAKNLGIKHLKVY